MAEVFNVLEQEGDEGRAQMLHQVATCWNERNKPVHFSVRDAASSDPVVRAGVALQTVEVEEQPLVARLVRTHNLFPVPVFVSALCLSLHEELEAPAQWSSYDALKMLSQAEAAAFLKSELPLATRQAIRKQRDDVLSSVLAHTRRHVFPKLFCFPLESQAALEALMMETFHMSVNCIRVLELTILDLLELQKGSQERYVTPNDSLMPEDSRLLGPVVDRLVNQFTVHVLRVQKEQKALFPADVDVSSIVIDRVWFSDAGLRALWRYTRSWARSAFTRVCANPLCGALEKAPGDFNVCSKCHFTPYHQAECQTADWKRHKHECGKESPLDVFNRERLLISE